MNAVFSPAVRGANRLRSFINLPSASKIKTRVAVFGRFMGDYHLFKELLSGELADRVTVTGVATDDPNQPFTHANVRLWKYAHTRDDELLVPRFAAQHGLPVFIGRVKTPEFYQMFLDDWQPQLCLMSTFGQKIPTALINYPALGFYNFHHSADTWPSYPGPDPIAAMIRDGRKHLVLTIHKVNDVIDGGEFVARSHRVPIPEGINAVAMHRISWPQMGPFIRREVGAMRLLGVYRGLASAAGVARQGKVIKSEEECQFYCTDGSTRKSASRSARVFDVQQHNVHCVHGIPGRPETGDVVSARADLRRIETLPRTHARRQRNPSH